MPRDGDKATDDRSPAARTVSGEAAAETGESAVLPARRAASEIVRQMAEPLAPGLYLVATPIGNLADITLRALSTLARADAIYCEDTRHSRTLLAHYAIATRLEAYHEHNAARERPRILSRLADGARIALISDAGTPLVSDPGYKLVRSAIDAGHRVESLPGPSAVMAALTSSGLPTDRFLFAGFLPVKSAARRTRAAELVTVPATIVLFEAPSRLAASLSDLAAILGDRPAAVARELTKRFEEVQRGTLAELAAAFAANAAIKGEFAILVAPPSPTEAGDDDVERAMSIALETMSSRDAAKHVALELGVPKSRAYEIGLKLTVQLASRTQSDREAGDADET